MGVRAILVAFLSCQVNGHAQMTRGRATTRSQQGYKRDVAAEVAAGQHTRNTQTAELSRIDLEKKARELDAWEQELQKREMRVAEREATALKREQALMGPHEDAALLRANRATPVHSVDPDGAATDLAIPISSFLESTDEELAASAVSASFDLPHYTAFQEASISSEHSS